MTSSLAEIKDLLNNTENEILSHYWENEFVDKLSNWIDLVIENTKHMKLPFDMNEYLVEN